MSIRASYSHRFAPVNLCMRYHNRRSDEPSRPGRPAQFSRNLRPFHGIRTFTWLSSRRFAGDRGRPFGRWGNPAPATSSAGVRRAFSTTRIGEARGRARSRSAPEMVTETGPSERLLGGHESSSDGVSAAVSGPADPRPGTSVRSSRRGDPRRALRRPHRAGGKSGRACSRIPRRRAHPGPSGTGSPNGHGSTPKRPPENPQGGVQTLGSRRADGRHQYDPGKCSLGTPERGRR
jgi:hypothetical protein